MAFTYDMEEKERQEEESKARERNNNDWELAPEEEGRDEMSELLAN